MFNVTKGRVVYVNETIMVSKGDKMVVVARPNVDWRRTDKILMRLGLKRVGELNFNDDSYQQDLKEIE